VQAFTPSSRRSESRRQALLRAAAPANVGVARRAVGGILAEAGISDPVFDDVRLITTELVGSERLGRVVRAVFHREWYVMWYDFWRSTSCLSP